MARGRRSRSQHSTGARRDASVHRHSTLPLFSGVPRSQARRRSISQIYSDDLSIPTPPVPFSSRSLRQPRADRREYSPSRYSQIQTFSGNQKYNLTAGFFDHTVSFENARRLLICARRQIRSRVLHALRKTGKVGQARPRRNAFSDISCKE